ncbi:MAG: hypothetical protein AB1714_06105 [Acidobacteriota bacterium]
MALRVLRTLVWAYYVSAWNRVRRQSGLGGIVATAATLGIVGLVLLVPCVMMLTIGLSLGRDIVPARDPEALFYWNLLQALFTTAFAFLGAVRYKPAFTAREIGPYPVRPIYLLLAELPASVFEVFPLLGIAGIFFSNLGLAVVMPRAGTAVLVLAIHGIIAMLALQLIAGSLKRFLVRHWVVALVVASSSITAVFLLGREQIRWLVRTALPFLPGSMAYMGLMDLWRGQGLAGVGRMLGAFAATGVLLVVAGRMHYREIFSEAGSRGFQLTRSSALRFGSLASGIGRLFLKLILSSNSGRTHLLMPLLFSGPGVVVLWAIRTAMEQKETLPEIMVSYAQSILSLPLLGILLFLLVPLNSEIWMNQFGWDRAGVRALLSLPISHRDLVLGKMFGLLQLTLLQLAIAIPPLLVLYTPSLREVVWGLGASGTAFMVTTGVGHVFSVRFPRAIEREGASHLPLYVSWIPTVLLLLIGTMLYAVGAMPLAHLALLGLSILAYIRLLPLIAAQVERHQELLLRM